MHWTIERLQALSSKQRETLFDNARQQNSPDAAQIVRLLLENDLLVREGGGYSRDHPIIQRIEEVIRSDEGRAAAKGATDQGEAAMAGVDPLLSAALGRDYGERDTTNWAGSLTAEIMAEAGYIQTGKKALPPTCVAKTAAFFEKRGR
ncbi:hypothetical protein [Sphingomonas mesophila]|uniref:hypothetical protein n=1 Tax=Sphingomonas mesophila TaxID=2303576 RepID=UPI0013C2C1BB|nr:hypothetical protein [Sphingomonas mesophila]